MVIVSSGWYIWLLAAVVDGKLHSDKSVCFALRHVSKYVFLSFRREFQPLCSVNSKKLPTPQPAYNAPSTLAAMLLHISDRHYLNKNTRGVCSYSLCASVVVEVKNTRFSSCIHTTFRTAAGLDAMMTRVKSLPLMGTKPRSSSPVFHNFFVLWAPFSWMCLSAPPPNSYTLLLTPLSRILPKKRKGPQLVKKFTACFGTQRFITAFTRAR